MFKTASGKKREKCSVCHQRQPDLLPLQCTHPLCAACIKSSLLANRNKKVIVCQLCQQTSILSEDLLKDRMARRSYKSTQKKKEQPHQADHQTVVKDRPTNNTRPVNPPKEIHTSNLHILESPSSDKEKHCNYHFNEKTHVCATCLRGVCVRCLQTLCEEHKVYNRQKGLQVIRNDLVSLYSTRVEQAELKFKQLTDRKRFYQQRCQKMGEEIHLSFKHIRDVLARKQQELLDYCIHIQKKVDRDYQRIYQSIQYRIDLLENFKSMVMSQNFQLEKLKRELKSINLLPELHVELTANIDMEQIVDQSRLERVLFQIEELTAGGVTSFTKQRKYRTSTENAERNSLKVFRSIPPHKAGGAH